jgi:hypothetical protein
MVEYSTLNSKGHKFILHASPPLWGQKSRTCCDWRAIDWDGASKRELARCSKFTTRCIWLLSAKLCPLFRCGTVTTKPKPTISHLRAPQPFKIHGDGGRFFIVLDLKIEGSHSPRCVIFSMLPNLCVGCSSSDSSILSCSIDLNWCGCDGAYWHWCLQV